MEDIIFQIRRANEAGLYYVALFSALLLPDICGALDSRNGLASKKHFIAWFDKHVTPFYNGFFNGKECYFFRCSMVHRGSTQHPLGSYKRIIFVEPTVGRSCFHNNIINDALNIDAHIFCNDICCAAEHWWSAVSEKPVVKNNFNRFIRRYAYGLEPYIVGIPVIT